MAKKQYRAINRILLKAGRGSSGAEYAEPKSLFQIEEGEGERLVKLGAAEPYKKQKGEEPEQKAPEKKPDAGMSDEDRDAAILDAVRKLVDGGTEKPTVEAVNAEMPEANTKRVTAKDRDAALEVIAAEGGDGEGGGLI